LKGQARGEQAKFQKMADISLEHLQYVNIMAKIQQAFQAIVNDRKRLGILTQREIAAQIGCTTSMLSGLLSGERRLNEEWILRLCAALNVTLADLEAGGVPPEDIPIELRAYLEKLKLLWENPEHMAFRNVSRSIDDWLRILNELPHPGPVPARGSESKTEYAKVVESPAKPVAENVRPFERNVDAPRPAVYVKGPSSRRFPLRRPTSASRSSASGWKSSIRRSRTRCTSSRWRATAWSRSICPATWC